MERIRTQKSHENPPLRLLEAADGCQVPKPVFLEKKSKNDLRFLSVYKK